MIDIKQSPAEEIAQQKNKYADRKNNLIHSGNGINPAEDQVSPDPDKWDDYGPDRCAFK
ncbi:hypothetical protein D3C86_1872360 [compost metagenome]